MNLKTVVPLSASAVLGLVAMIVAAQLVQQRPVIIQEGDQQHALAMVDAVVAARDLAPGTLLTAADLATTRFEAGGAPPDAPKSVASLVNRVIKFQIPRGQVFHPSMLAEKGVAGGLSAVIPDGMRAVTIEVNEFTGLAGLIEPGNHVDVLCRLKDEQEKTGEQTRTVVQDVQILAIGQTLTNSRAIAEAGPTVTKAPEEGTLPGSSKQNVARSVTLLLSPENAERIDLAMGENPTMKMRLVLRSPTDRKASDTAGATMASLLGNADGTDGSGARLASARKGPTTRATGDVFDNAVKLGGTKPVGRSVTVIRAGVPSIVEVEESTEATAAAE